MLLLISKLISGEADLFLARVRRLAVLYAAIALLALSMAGFLLGALFGALAEEFGAVETALGFAAVCFVLLVLAYGLLLRARRPRPGRTEDRLQRDIASIAGVAALSNAPLLLASLGKRKSLLLVPVAVLGAWGLWRAFRASRNR